MGPAGCALALSLAGALEGALLMFLGARLCFFFPHCSLLGSRRSLMSFEIPHRARYRPLAVGLRDTGFWKRPEGKAGPGLDGRSGSLVGT